MLERIALDVDRVLRAGKRPVDRVEQVVGAQRDGELAVCIQDCRPGKRIQIPAGILDTAAHDLIGRVLRPVTACVAVGQRLAGLPVELAVKDLPFSAIGRAGCVWLDGRPLPAGLCRVTAFVDDGVDALAGAAQQQCLPAVVAEAQGWPAQIRHGRIVVRAVLAARREAKGAGKGERIARAPDASIGRQFEGREDHRARPIAHAVAVQIQRASADVPDAERLIRLPAGFGVVVETGKPQHGLRERNGGKKNAMLLRWCQAGPGISRWQCDKQQRRHQYAGNPR